MAYDLSDQLQAGVVYIYDENFESRASAELKVRFGSGAKPKSTLVVIAALNETPSNRDIRTANSEYISVVLAPGTPPITPITRDRPPRRRPTRPSPAPAPVIV